jgi:hypothetical protein
MRTVGLRASFEFRRASSRVGRVPGRRPFQECQQRQAERQQLLQAAQIPSPAAPSEPPPAPCERCGRPITGEPGIRYENLPPEDGRYCPDCRDDLAHQPPGLFKALFSRRD